jgi:hypothetical protein
MKPDQPPHLPDTSWQQPIMNHETGDRLRPS